MVSTQSEGRSLCTWASPSSPHRLPSPSGWEPSLVAWLVLSQYEKCILTMDVSPALVVGPSAYSGIYIGVWSYSALLTGHFPPLLTLFFDPRSGISFESYSSSIQPELQCTSHSRHSGVRLSHALYQITQIFNPCKVLISNPNLDVIARALNPSQLPN